jgi:NDP-sugar pyrophosphorylase family protein
MDNYKILITTSGIGSRLGELTKFTNKSLIRVGKKPAISYIIEKYPQNIELVITLGHYGDQVKDFLELVYPNRKFTFVRVNPYEGPGSSLVYSMLCAKDQLQCPFILHVCDTLTFDVIPPPTTNWCAGVKSSEKASQYRTHNVAGNKLLKINEKGGSHFDRIHIGICGINSYKEFWEQAQKIYDHNPNNNQWSDCHVIDELIYSGIEIESLLLTSWMDIGNIETLEKTRSEIEDKSNILDKIDESIYIIDDNVVKFFYDTSVVKNRVERGKQLENITPKIEGVKDNFYKYKYIKGLPLSRTINIVKFRRLLEWSKENLWGLPIYSPNAYARCESFYFDKSKLRIKKFLDNNNIKDATHFINGIQVPTALEMLDKIVPGFLCNDMSYKFHGDFILENIIDTNDGNFKLIDWRQDFGGSLTEGDIYYDIAKLHHNLIFNHDIVNRGLFKIEIENDKITCDIMRNNIMVECQEILNDFLIKNNLSVKKINILTPLIWLNMSPLHEYPINMFLFFFGKYNLAEALYYQTLRGIDL